MSSLFCCGSIKPYRSQRLDHELKFTTFMSWAKFPKAASPSAENQDGDELANLQPGYAVQLVRQVNYGPLESRRYFIPIESRDEAFAEISEQQLIQANFQKLNSYKNFRCDEHDKFFEVNLYQKDPVNKHHWRANLDRPASSIDL